MDDKEIVLFEKTSVTKAVMSFVIPTVISQLITVLYNMADTFFIGQTGDPNQVAAANLCMPMFFFTDRNSKPIWYGRIKLNFTLPWYR